MGAHNYRESVTIARALDSGIVEPRKPHGSIVALSLAVAHFCLKLAAAGNFWVGKRACSIAKGRLKQKLLARQELLDCGQRLGFEQRGGMAEARDFNYRGQFW